MPPPHLILFNPDQMRADALGHLGNRAAHTPRLDAAAHPDTGDFVSFRHAFCQAPVCTPSRCSFMTGHYPHTRGHRTMHHMLHADRGETNLLRELKRAGYHVVWAGKNDLVPARDRDTFAEHADVILPLPADAPHTNVPGGHDDALRPPGPRDHSFFRGLYPQPADGRPFQDADWARVRAVCDYLHTYTGDAPLCVYLPLDFPHPPYVAEDPYYSAIDRDAAAQHWPRAVADLADKPSILRTLRDTQGLADWTEAQWTELRAVYLGMVARVDAQFGQVMQTLRDTDRYEDSAVFFFSDHGDYTGDLGLVEKTQNTFDDPLTNVPLLYKPPAGQPNTPGPRDALVELIDFTATAYELAGIADPGYDHFGRSLTPLLADPAAAHRDAVFCEGGRLAHEHHCAEQNVPDAIDPSSDYHPRLVAQRDPVAHGKATMCRTATHKFVRRDAERDELYDLAADPHERHNRVDDPTLAGVLATLRERMLTWYQQTCDVVPREPDRRW